MTIEQLQKTVDATREKIKNWDGEQALCTSNGPIGIDLIDALVKVIETQDKRITELELKTADMEPLGG